MSWSGLCTSAVRITSPGDGETVTEGSDLVVSCLASWDETPVMWFFEVQYPRRPRTESWQEDPDDSETMVTEKLRMFDMVLGRVNVTCKSSNRSLIPSADHIRITVTSSVGKFEILLRDA